MLEQQPPKPAPIAPETQDSGESGRHLAESGTDHASPYNSAAIEPTTPLPSAEQPVAMPHRIPLWLQRVERMLRVIVRMYVGVLVCLAPWFRLAWEGNPLFAESPGLQHFIAQGYVRGLVSAFGLLNLWIALRDAIQGARE
jgi:hypothetical protein